MYTEKNPHYLKFEKKCRKCNIKQNEKQIVFTDNPKMTKC